MGTNSTVSGLRAGVARAWRGALWLIFALALIIPKMSRLQRHRRGWNFARIATAFAGAALMAFAAARGHAFPLFLSGALVLVSALLLRPEHQEISIDARARELGALIVVDGGYYIDAAGEANRAKLFIGSDRLWALDSDLQILLDIPLQQVRTLSVQPAGADWKLRLEGNQAATEFLYRGNFSEHLARVADATVRSRLIRDLPVLR